MKTIIIRSSGIPENNTLKVVIDKKMIVKAGVGTKRVEIEEEEIEVQAKWLWCSSKIYKMPVYEGMILEVIENKCVNNSFRILCMLLFAMWLVLFIITHNVLAFILFTPFIFPMYYITFGCKRYLQIREVEK